MADLGGGCRGCTPSPPEMKLSSLYLKFVYLTAYRLVTSFFRSAPPPKKNPGSAPVVAVVDVVSLVAVLHYISFHFNSRKTCC